MTAKVWAGIMVAVVGLCGIGLGAWYWGAAQFGWQMPAFMPYATTASGATVPAVVTGSSLSGDSSSDTVNDAVRDPLTGDQQGVSDDAAVSTGDVKNAANVPSEVSVSVTGSDSVGTDDEISQIQIDPVQIDSESDEVMMPDDTEVSDSADITATTPPNDDDRNTNNTVSTGDFLLLHTTADETTQIVLIDVLLLGQQESSDIYRSQTTLDVARADDTIGYGLIHAQLGGLHPDETRYVAVLECVMQQVDRSLFWRYATLFAKNKYITDTGVKAMLIKNKKIDLERVMQCAGSDAMLARLRKHVSDAEQAFGTLTAPSVIMRDLRDGRYRVLAGAQSASQIQRALDEWRDKR